MPIHIKAGIAATASIATMAYTKYGSGGQDHHGSPGSSSQQSSSNNNKKADIHSETVKQMYMWKC